ncbi:AAA family ATPase [Candidatus Woesearchaeota archaeon]|nr:AAA family ATPase [Candidatus Woesearchaeota archaeon]
MEKLKDNLLVSDPFPDVKGQARTKKELASALLVGRHLIIAGPPGIGKTTLAKGVAKLLPEIEVNDCSYHCDPGSPLCPECRNKKPKTKRISGEDRFVRIQGSPDLTVEDILGDIDPIKALKFGPLSIEAFTPGKIFRANNGILFFDELNRCPEKLQNALLQVLQEGYATIGSYDIDIPANFIFIATMNPEDFSGTERLSTVLMDRFDVVYMSYPESLKVEKDIVKCNSEPLVKFPEPILDKAIGFVRDLRESPNLERFPSVRASIGLYERAQSNALISGRDEVAFADVQEAILSVISHRIKLKPSIRYLKENRQFIQEEFAKFFDSNKFSRGEDQGDSL